MSREQYGYRGDARENKESTLPEAKIDSRASKDHPGRNEDAALGDVIRLREEAVKPPEMHTKDSAADSEAVRQARERELKVADQLKDKKVFGVLDGISGGREGGGTGVVASRLASARLSERMAEMPPGLTVEQTKEHMLKAMQEADADVKAYRDAASASGDDARKKELKQMGTTADMVALVDNPDGSQEAVIGHVGDSRVYLFDEKTKTLRKLTIDENVVGYLHRMGQISREQYDLVMDTDDISQLPPDLQKLGANFGMRDTRSAKNTLFNAIGTGGVTKDNVFSVRVEPGQKLMITSDGVHDNLNDAELQELLASGKTMEQIAEAAYDTGRKPDDISGAMIEIKGEAPEARAARQAEEQKDMQMRTWEKEVGDARAEIARLEALKAAGAAGNKRIDGRADVMMNVDGRAIMEMAQLGGEKGVDKLIRDWKIFSLSREYQVAQSDMAETQKDLGMSASQAAEQLAVQRNIIDWQRQVQSIARASMPGRGRSNAMMGSREAMDYVSQRMAQGESPKDIIDQAAMMEKNAELKAGRLSGIEKMGERLREITDQWQQLEGEKRNEAAAMERSQMDAARRQLDAAGPSRQEAAPQQQPQQQPAKKKPWYKRLFGG